MKTCPRCGVEIVPIPGRGRARKWCSDDCRKRAHGENGPPCHCGQPKLKHSSECWACSLKTRKAKQTKRFEFIKAMWDEGLPIAEIAAAMDWSENATSVLLNRMRRAGWDVPLRRLNGHQPVTTKQQCRDQFTNALGNSDIRRPKRCEECGEVGLVEGHHLDYSRPLYVMWLCRACHHEAHGHKSRLKAVA